jgi:hypothetical protein
MASGVTPTIGRDFRADEDQVPGRDAVIILGHTLWEQEFDADPGVLGRRVRISGLDFTVVGITPRSFTGMDQFARYDFYVPLMMSPRLIADPRTGSLEVRDARNLTLKGRLKAGVSHSSAQAELDNIAADLERAYPATNKNRRLAVRTELQERIAESAGCDVDRDAVDAGHRGAAGRVRKRRGPADQPRSGARARDGAAPRDRRGTRAPGPPTGD